MPISSLYELIFKRIPDDDVLYMENDAQLQEHVVSDERAQTQVSFADRLLSNNARERTNT